MLASDTSSPTPRSSWVTWPLIGALLALITGTLSASILNDPDTLWHVAVGRWIVTHRALPMQDMFSWTMPGAPWTAHEWLSEVLFYWAWSDAGFRGVTVLVATSFAITAAIILRFFCTRMEPLHVVPTGLLFVSVISTHLLSRPHALVWPVMAAWIALMVMAVDTDRIPPWWSLLVLVAWANLHASFTLGLGLAAAMALDALVEAPTRAARIETFKRWSLFGVGCLIAVSINPNGLGTLIHAGRIMQMKETLAVIGEWKSADFHEFQLVLLWIILIMGLGLLGRLRLSPVRAIVVIGLFYMALKHARYHSTLALASSFLLAAPLGRGLKELRADASSDDHSTLDMVMRRLCAPSHPWAVLVAIIVGALWTVVGRPAMRAEPPESIAPAKAVAALQQLPAGRLLNGYEFGGYLIFRDIPVFVDGRADMYGDAFVKALADAFTMKEPHGFERYLEHYRITTTLLATKSPAVELLDHLPTWRRVYGDSIAVIHVQDTVASPMMTPTAAPPSSTPTPATVR